MTSTDINREAKLLLSQAIKLRIQVPEGDLPKRADKDIFKAIQLLVKLRGFPKKEK